MKIILLLILSLFTYELNAQNLFVPKEIDKAYANLTRSRTGSPGDNYWQNKSRYDIDVKVDSYTQTFSGSATIIYINNSPSALDKIVFRTYQDFSKPGKSRDWEIGENNFSEGMIISKLEINGNEVDLKSKKVSRPGTNLIVKLDNEIISKSECTIKIEWSFKILKDFPRMGMYDSTSYMIAYWYPQVAVYDDIDGWDMTDHKGLVEFYNDFNDYNVKVSTDRPNMCVWATGTLQNPNDIFTDKYIDKYSNALKGQDFFEVDCSILGKENQITKNEGKIVWHYKAKEVPDFAFAMSDHYKWKMKTVKINDLRSVNLNAAFRPNAIAYNKYDVFGIAEKFIEYLSNTMPGVEYPYPSMTIFNGEGGMEFPMMVNDDDTETWESTVYLTSHEMSHTYFPFYMGINERKYAWMEEGWAMYIPQEFQNKMQRFAPDNADRDTSRQDSKLFNVRSYLRNAGTFNDIPMLSPSNQLRSPSYRLNAYNKAALVYDILTDMVGKENFNKFMKEYINTWNGKHPTPYDFFNLFNTVTQRQLQLVLEEMVYGIWHN